MDEHIKTCKACHSDFMPRYEWQEMCWGCFYASPKGKAWKARKKAERNGFGCGEEDTDRSYSQGGRHGFHDNSGFHYEEPKREYNGRFRSPHEDEVGGVRVGKELLRKLIMLCHPDKHGDSTISNEVTKELLAMKERMR